MSELSFVFQGKVYQAKKGEIISADYNPAFGEWIRMTTEEYDFVAHQIALDKGKLLYKIDEIVYFSDENPYPTGSEVFSTTPPNLPPDLSKLKKADLLHIAQEIGFDVSTKLTKKDLIELIEGM